MKIDWGQSEKKETKAEEFAERIKTMVMGVYKKREMDMGQENIIQMGNADSRQRCAKSRDGCLGSRVHKQGKRAGLENPGRNEISEPSFFLVQRNKKKPVHDFFNFFCSHTKSWGGP